MYAPVRDDEITGSVRYLDEQLTAIRSAAYGLTEQQAASSPCRSVLSVGGIIKHVTEGMQGTVDRLAGVEPSELDEAGFADYHQGFIIGESETTAGAIAAFDEVRPRYLAALSALNPDAELLEDPAPWYGIYDRRPANARYTVGHQIEEMARHAGHSDIIREQIDGVAVPTLVMSLAGVPANQFFEPYRPEPGTIGADWPTGTPTD